MSFSAGQEFLAGNGIRVDPNAGRGHAVGGVWSDRLDGSRNGVRMEGAAPAMCSGRLGAGSMKG
ncbi:hypothetical protein [Actinophytocola sp.]|uniref:hypothetical protein n=1 Tax=Actinophytocola sp. TaxID=1872138 RepID=UPI002D7EC1A5|nr:hypothetical protein [Actinophytocola sp.]HET9141158.1 hypothetical protein [Actinophytocola sp.]HEU5111151.1 hypothetical protein [Micromonosporaceae bacterium]